MFTGARTASQATSGWTTVQTTSHLSVAPEIDTGNDTRRLIETIVCSIDRLALDTAIVMSGVNTLRQPHTALKADDIARFIPQQETQLSLMLETLSEQSGVAFSLPETEHLLAHIYDGRTLLQTYVSEETELGRQHARIVYAERLNLVWVEICRSVKQLIDETNIEMRLSLPHAYRQNSAVLSSLLSGAMNGLSPCLNEQAQLYAPQLPQQRRWPRHSVLQSCTIECNGIAFDAFVLDASAGGLGLEQMPNDLARNTAVRVTMECGRIFDCIVAWSKGGRSGVKFHAQLRPTDPLLLG